MVIESYCLLVSSQMKLHNLHHIYIHHILDTVLCFVRAQLPVGRREHDEGANL